MTLKTRWDNTVEYIRSVYSELKKVHWPSRTQLIGYTAVVLIAVAVIGVIIWLFDWGLSYLMQLLFDAFS
ncbi:MAG TPA: preprotein translocase subunit SecE [Syntrophomonadaceae bacterium]|nr:preprotein translocase subunit SecE [Syntrophomonadaceae bacterium]HQA07964.1 preprotein translocase subunit SecE [Syntrophomonadaceae bacterium]HQE23781.1 preprotein translocase subunit SecE [Syntrophomonadaceae bacterium]